MLAEATPSAAIRASRVIGTTVTNAGGEFIGFVEDIVLDKLSSSILFVIVAIERRLKIGPRTHPVPWATLRCDYERLAYVVPLSIDPVLGALGATSWE
jgi:sporulation protein YlmC with PRC-barrel domain